MRKTCEIPGHPLRLPAPTVGILLRMKSHLLVAAIGALAGAGCGIASPSPVPQAGAPAADGVVLAVLVDRTTGFSTSDVRDADEQILRFNSKGELIWVDGEIRFPGYIADDRVITADRVCDACYFFVRFGTRDGEPRAYLTWAGEDTDAHPATLLDVEVVAGRLVVESTALRVPRT